MEYNASLVNGLGMLSCRQFLASQQDDAALYHAKLQWIMGYTSAMNSLFGPQGRFGENLEWDTVANWLERYCRENPDHTLAEASATLYSTWASNGSQRVIH